MNMSSPVGTVTRRTNGSLRVVSAARNAVQSFLGTSFVGRTVIYTADEVKSRWNRQALVVRRFAADRWYGPHKPKVQLTKDLERFRLLKQRANQGNAAAKGQVAKLEDFYAEGILIADLGTDANLQRWCRERKVDPEAVKALRDSLQNEKAVIYSRNGINDPAVQANYGVGEIASNGFRRSSQKTWLKEIYGPKWIAKLFVESPLFQVPAEMLKLPLRLLKVDVDEKRIKLPAEVNPPKNLPENFEAVQQAYQAEHHEGFVRAKSLLDSQWDGVQSSEFRERRDGHLEALRAINAQVVPQARAYFEALNQASVKPDFVPVQATLDAVDQALHDSPYLKGVDENLRMWCFDTYFDGQTFQAQRRAWRTHYGDERINLNKETHETEAKQDQAKHRQRRAVQNARANYYGKLTQAVRMQMNNQINRLLGRRTHHQGDFFYELYQRYRGKNRERIRALLNQIQTVQHLTDMLEHGQSFEEYEQELKAKIAEAPILGQKKKIKKQGDVEVPTPKDLEFFYLTADNEVLTLVDAVFAIVPKEGWDAALTSPQAVTLFKTLDLKGYANIAKALKDQHQFQAFYYRKYREPLTTIQELKARFGATANPVQVLRLVSEEYYVDLESADLKGRIDSDAQIQALLSAKEAAWQKWVVDNRQHTLETQGPRQKYLDAERVAKGELAQFDYEFQLARYDDLVSQLRDASDLPDEAYTDYTKAREAFAAAFTALNQHYRRIKGPYLTPYFSALYLRFVELHQNVVGLYRLVGHPNAEKIRIMSAFFDKQVDMLNQVTNPEMPGAAALMDGIDIKYFLDALVEAYLNGADPRNADDIMPRFADNIAHRLIDWVQVDGGHDMLRYVRGVNPEWGPRARAVVQNMIHLTFFDYKSNSLMGRFFRMRNRIAAEGTNFLNLPGWSLGLRYFMGEIVYRGETDMAAFLSDVPRKGNSLTVYDYGGREYVPGSPTLMGDSEEGFYAPRQAVVQESFAASSMAGAQSTTLGASIMQYVPGVAETVMSLSGNSDPRTNLIGFRAGGRGFLAASRMYPFAEFLDVDFLQQLDSSIHTGSSYEEIEKAAKRQAGILSAGMLFEASVMRYGAPINGEEPEYEGDWEDYESPKTESLFGALGFG